MLHILLYLYNKPRAASQIRILRGTVAGMTAPGPAALALGRYQAMREEEKGMGGRGGPAEINSQ